jgi:hypothetical protein
MALFAPCDCAGLFAQQTNGLTQTLTLFRPTGSQNSAGEWITTYPATSTITGELHPKSEGFLREVQGIVHQVAYTLFVMLPNPDVQEKDRTTISGAQLEVTTVLRWIDHSEIELNYVGR